MRHGAVALTAALFLIAAPAQASHVPFAAPLPLPTVLTGDDITLRMSESQVPILPGAPTRMWTFDGSFPGPTIRRPAGKPTRVTVVNDLPRAAGAMSIHHHGAHVPASEDGQPDDELIPPGGRRTYTYPLEERAAFQWYHDHRMDVTGRNVWNGLAGMFIVDDEFERRLPLPKGDYDVPLMIADRSFDPTNQLTYPAPLETPGGLAPGGAPPPNDQAVGDHLLVNGAPQPHFDVADRRYRLRILNASNFRGLRLRLSNDQPMTQIGTESGLLPAPVARQEIDLGPAERAEVVVDFAGLQGQQVELVSDAGPALRFRVNRHAEDDSRVPERLRPAPELSPPAVTRAFTFGLGVDTRKGRPAWTINQQVFDHHRADATPQIGSTETWQLVNATSGELPHWIHIHGVDFEVVTRDGRPPPAWEAGLKETVRVDPGEVVVVAARFTDHVGRFVFHCHMLEHEDNGMMGQYEVQGQPPGPPGGGGAAAAKPNLAVHFVRPPRRVRARGRMRFRVRVRNTSRVRSRPARVRVRFPRALGGRRVTLRVRSLRPGQARTRVLRARAARKLRPERFAVRAQVTRGGGAARRDDRATLRYRARSRQRARLATPIRKTGGPLCRLPT